MSEINLLPCPFCGGKATTYKRDYGFGAMCKNTPFCCIMTAGHKTEKGAIKAWNTRKPMEQIVERLEEEKKKYEEECSRDIDNYRQYVRRTHVNICKFIDIVRAGGKE